MNQNVPHCIDYSTVHERRTVCLLHERRVRIQTRVDRKKTIRRNTLTIVQRCGAIPRAQKIDRKLIRVCIRTQSGGSSSTFDNYPNRPRRRWPFFHSQKDICRSTERPYDAYYVLTMLRWILCIGAVTNRPCQLHQGVCSVHCLLIFEVNGFQ